MSASVIVIIVIIALWIVIPLIGRLIQSREYNKYQALFMQQEFDQCLELLDKPWAKLSFPRYNWLYMRLNCQMFLADSEASSETIQEMLGLRVNRDQRVALLTRAFSFYIDEGDYERAEAALDELRTKADDDVVADCERTYDIYANKSYAYIKQMKSELETVEDEENKTGLYFALSLQYRNKGDERSAEKYLGLARASLGVPEEGCECGGECHCHGDGECADPGCECHGDGSCGDPNCECHHHGDEA